MESIDHEVCKGYKASRMIGNTCLVHTATHYIAYKGLF